MSRKRICFIATVPMAVSAFLRLHIEHLAQTYEVFVVSNFSGHHLSSDERVTYIDLPLARDIALYSDLRVLIMLVRLFCHHRFDVVHSVTPKAGLLGMIAARIACIPVRIHWFTGQVWVTRRGLMRAVLKAADRVISMMASHTLADSPSQKDFLITERVCKGNQVEVIGDGSICGVDGKRFRPDPQARERVRAEHGIPNGASVVLFLGRLNKDKGLREMADSMLELNDRFPTLHWLVVGPDEGGMVEHILSVAGGLGDRLHFQGFTQEPEAYMAAADIFCLPSYREGFGSSVLEAAATGIPSVATRIYGLTDAVEDGVSGLLVSPACVPELVEALQRLLDDKQLLSTMGAYARHRALQRFSRERIVEGLSVFYARIFAQRDKSDA